MQLFTRPSDLRMDSRWKSKHLSRYERERVKNWNPWYGRERLPRELKKIQTAFQILGWKCSKSAKKSKHVPRYERKCKRGSLGRSWREWARSLTLKDISPSWPETTCDSNSLSFSRWTIRSDDTKQVQATTPWFSIIQIFAGNAQCYSELFTHIQNCPDKLKTLWMTHDDPDKIKIIWRDSKVWYWSVGMTETIWAKLTGDPLRQVGACVWLPNLAGTDPCHRGTDPNSPTRVNKLEHTNT